MALKLIVFKYCTYFFNFDFFLFVYLLIILNKDKFQIFSDEVQVNWFSSFFPMLFWFFIEFYL